MTPREALQELLAGNERFASGHAYQYAYTHADHREMAVGQHPLATVLSCSDSRVVPEVIFHQPLGRLFVLRTPGNTVSPDALAGTEYSLQRLNVGLFLVLGHTQCGAVTAAVEGSTAIGAIGGVLLRIQPAVYRVPADVASRVTAVAEQNVLLTVEGIRTQSMMPRDTVQKGGSKLLGAMYDIETGRVVLLQ